MDKLKMLGEVGLGSRLKRVSDQLMKETQEIYDANNIDFDPYLFPVFHSVWKLKETTNTELREALHISQPAITQTLHKLKNKKLIQLTSDKKDKRKKLIKLSAKGISQREIMQPIWNAIDATVKEITSGTSNTMLAHIERLEDAIRDKSLVQKICKRIPR